MAGCYHDEQDFKSDPNIEVAREGDILECGQDLDEIKCNKNPGHQGFIPFKDLTLQHLPHEVRFREVFKKIKVVGSVVVRLVVLKLKNGRWIKESGSGYVFKNDNKYFIKTYNHVVKTDDEVKQCTVEFHYYDDSRSSVLISRGVKLISTCFYKDLTKFTFHPVPDFLHQVDFQYNLNRQILFVIDKHNQCQFGVTSFYTFDTFPLKFNTYDDLNSSLIDFMIILWPDCSISYLKSCYFKFQPIPSNIQELTYIEIHIDEDDGNSRVIPGDVVKFVDEFVVKISESIFQDEVKKCRLVWEGEVIGRGTRLYFEQKKLTDMYSAVQIEFLTNLGLDEYWIFECNPLPRGTEDKLLAKSTSNMCCISHPHGGIKMVTFGRMLAITEERFNNQGRRIDKAEPNLGCKCEEIICAKYSCKTCPGSSGSPVVGLGKGMFSHFQGERVQGVLTNVSELVENINLAWSSTDRNISSKTECNNQCYINF